MIHRALLLSLVAALIAVGAAFLTRQENVLEPGSSGDSGSGDSGCASTNLPPGVTTREVEFADPCYRFEGYRITKPLNFCVDPVGRTLDRPLIDYVQDALARWNADTGVDLPITIGGTCPGAQPKVGSGLNAIAWGPLSGEEVGYTTVKYRHGVADEAVVTLESLPERLPESCLDAVLLHEFGHVLGLQHQDDPDSIMRPVTDCPHNPSLSDRDIAAVQLLYGSSGG